MGNWLKNMQNKGGLKGPLAALLGGKKNVSIHPLGAQAHPSQSPTITGLCSGKIGGAGFILQQDEVLKLTRPAGTYRQLVSSFQRDYGNSFNDKLSLYFITPDHVAGEEKPFEVLKDYMEYAFERPTDRYAAEMFDSIMPEVYEGIYEGYQEGAPNIEQRRSIENPDLNVGLINAGRLGATGQRIQSYAGDSSYFAHRVMDNKALRSRKCDLVGSLGHEMGHGIYNVTGLEEQKADDVIDTYQSSLGEKECDQYLTHIDECYADGVSVYVLAKHCGEKGLAYAEAFASERTLSITTGSNRIDGRKYYTTPVMEAAIADARELLENEELADLSLEDIAERFTPVWEKNIPTMERFQELGEERLFLVQELGARQDGDAPENPSKLYELYQEHEEKLYEQTSFTPETDNDYDDALAQYKRDVAADLRGYANRHGQKEALASYQEDLENEVVLTQEFYGQNDIPDEELDYGELKIADRRSVIDFISQSIDHDLSKEPSISRA